MLMHMFTIFGSLAQAAMLDYRGDWPRLTFHNQVSLKSYDIFNQKAILHVVDANEPLSIANAIGKN